MRDWNDDTKVWLQLSILHGLVQGADDKEMEELARWVLVAFLAGVQQGQEEQR